jgi:uncharacterized protein DUF4232
MKRLLPAMAIVLIAGCSSNPDTKPTTTSSEPPTTTTTSPSPTPEAVECTDADLQVTNEEVHAANTMRRVLISFTNISDHPCRVRGYPTADLVIAGGQRLHVKQRPATVAHPIRLKPGEGAYADVSSYVIDTPTGNPCGHEGTLIVTAPNGAKAHTLPVSLPICSATVSAMN